MATLVQYACGVCANASLFLSSVLTTFPLLFVSFTVSFGLIIGTTAPQSSTVSISLLIRATEANGRTAS
jgi:hypothetical protein